MIDEFEPKIAKREKLKSLIGLIGPSGSGKSLSALLIAYGMAKEKYPNVNEAELWKKIGTVDTEHKRLLNYVGQKFNNIEIMGFHHVELKAPFNTDRYIAAITSLLNIGCEFVIIDGLSQQWQGSGGVIETHAKMAGNSFQNWGKLNPETTKLVALLTSYTVNVIATMRVKTEYVVENIDGKSVPRKIGLKPIQKDDLEYEFDTVFNLDMEHRANISKDITNLFGDELIITEDIGSIIFRYLELGIDVKLEQQLEIEKNEEIRIEAINQLKILANENETVKKLIVDCEFKAQKELDDFEMNLIVRVNELIKGGK